MIIFVMQPFRMGEGQVTSSEIGKGEVLNVLDPIDSETVVEQDFVAKSDSICSVALCFDTFGQERYGKVLFSLLSDSGKTLYEEKIDMSLMKDKEFVTVSFDEISPARGRKFTVRLTSTVNEASRGVSVWYRAKDADSLGVRINGEALEGTLRMKVGYIDNGIRTLKLVLWILVIFLSVVFVTFISGSYEKNFVLAAFTLGIFVIFLNPFPHVIDEATHFFRSYMVSQGDFYDETYIGRIGGNVTADFPTLVDEKLSIKTLYQNPSKWMKPLSAEKEFYYHPYMSSGIPVNHTFAAVGILITRLLRLPALFVILSGRIVSYIIYVILCYFAIKKAKYYKGMFFMISTLPVAFWLAGSYSVDPFVVGGALLFTSICLRHFFDKGGQFSFTWKEKAMLFVTALMFVSVKYLLYSPILLLLILIPKSKFRKNERLIVCGVTIILVAIMLIWQIYLLKRFPFTEDRNGDVNVARQIEYVLGHIAYTARVFLGYISENIFPHIEGFSNARGLSFITPLIGLMTVFGSVLEPDRYPFTDKKEKRKLAAISIVIFVICSLLIMASLYAGFTPVGKDAIEGIQTRYFLPILIFAMLPISMIPVTNSISNYREKISLLMGIGVMDTLASLLKTVFG